MHLGSLPATAQHVSGRCIKAASDLSRASIWLDECLHSHNHGSSTGLSRPSRLVAVGTADGTEPIKIVDDSDTGHEYLTLSYCWGRTGNLCTTAETYETFCTYIPWAKLPKTFQDAIQIARNLGVGHIWIDSLCIVQGDLHDWETESAKMADIYSGSLMTIMAAAASDSHGGCFQDRFAIQNTYSPLFQRGWVFQERLMSKRKLIFGDDQTYWECNTIVLSESDIRRRDKFAKYNRVRNDAFRIFSDPSYRLNCPRSRARLWMDLVADYSRCLLTYYTDRLPSLSGLARSFAQQSGESYVAGLWREQMPHSLCWRVYYRMSEESCEQDYCAPSWSWASVPGQVTFLPDSHNCELEIVSTNIQLASQDLYGALRTGSSICVRGRLRAATLVKMEKGRPLFSEIEEGPVSCRFMDRGDRNLPLELFYLEISHTCCLLLEETAIEKQFRRLGLSVLSEVSQEQDYLFHGLEKQTLTLV
ncbi:heterokaryon incompatibility protein [Paraphaeosphaeria sporulosa]